MAKVGRPTKYSLELVKDICRLLAEGNTVLAISKMPGMPADATIYEWLLDKPEFADLYARAQIIRAHRKFEELETQAYDRSRDKPLENGKGGYSSDTTAVQRDRLIVDTLKWQLAKMLPKLYGDKIQQEVSGADGAALVPSIVVTVKKD